MRRLPTNAQTLHAFKADESDTGESVEPSVVSPRICGKAKLVGTWLMQVPQSPGSSAFNALQTFTGDGTMTETSDLLAQFDVKAQLMASERQEE